MPWIRFNWDYFEGGNVEHIAEHGLTIDDVENAMSDPFEETVSKSSGLPAIYGPARDGRTIFVVFEEDEDDFIYVVTAYEV